MIIADRSLNNSIVLFQQGQISSNVTLIFHRQVRGKFLFTRRFDQSFALFQLKDQRYQCRAYQRENLSLTFE